MEARTRSPRSKLTAAQLREAAAEIEKLKKAADAEFDAWLDEYEYVLRRAFAAVNPEVAAVVLGGVPPLPPPDDPLHPKVAVER